MAILDNQVDADASLGGAVFKGDQNIVVMLNVTASDGTNPTLDAKLQIRDRSQNVWMDVPGAVFTQKTGASSAALYLAPHLVAANNSAVPIDLTGIDCRMYYTIGGSTPTFTFTTAVITRD